jgi:hypothetical protein
MAYLVECSLLLFLVLLAPLVASTGIAKLKSSTPLFGIQFPPFNTTVAHTGCNYRLVAAQQPREEQTKPAS